MSSTLSSAVYYKESYEMPLVYLPCTQTVAGGPENETIPTRQYS